MQSLNKLALTTAIISAMSLSQAHDAKYIEIGAVLPFSGGLELFGEQAKAGIELAVKEINENGGVLGHDLKVIYEDNKTDPKTSVEKANKLIRKHKVTALLGPITSNARDAMVPIINRFKTPLLYATNYEGGACNEYLFNFNTVPNQELDKLLADTQNKGAKKYYLFGADYIWPQKMFERAKAVISEQGGEVADTQFTPWGVKDFTPVIRNIMSSDADVLVFALPGADGITFIKQANELGLTKKVNIAFLGFSETYLGAFGDINANIQVAVPFVASADGAKPFVDKVKALNPKITGVSHYLFSHYNAVHALAKAIDTKQSEQATDIVAGLEGIELKTPAGKLTMNADNHHVSWNMQLASATGKVDTLIRQRELGIINPEPGCQVK